MNQMARISYIFLLLLLGESACTLIDATPQSTARPVVTETLATSNSPTMTTIYTNEREQMTDTASPLLETPTNPAQETTESQPGIVFSDLRNISSSNIQDVWWSPDSGTLYYGVLFEGNFAYNIEKRTSASVSLDEILRQTPTPEILTQLPSMYKTPHISPSGNRAIYIKLADAPPTITPDLEAEGGENISNSHVLEMWLWENGSSRSLGKIRQCWLDEQFWSTDEGKVVLVESGIPMIPCSGVEAQAWLIDLRTSKSYPLFPPSRFPPLQVYGFSPSGTYLLVGFFSNETGANLNLLNINTLDLIPLQSPVNMVLQWINERKILVEYRGDLPSSPYPIGILDIQTMEFIELLPVFNDLFVKNVKIAPNQGWIAFTTGKDPFSQDNLWVMEVVLAK